MLSSTAQRDRAIARAKAELREWFRALAVAMRAAKLAPSTG